MPENVLVKTERQQNFKPHVSPSQNSNNILFMNDLLVKMDSDASALFSS